MRSKKYCASLLAISVALVASSAKAQTAAEAKSQPAPSTSDTAVEDIIVTAQKRSESVQTIPVAVTALTGDQLARSGITDLEALQRQVPNLNFGQSLGVARIALRGIGLDNISTGAEGSIAFHVDGIFIARSAAALSSFYDLERVEVLRGPQGTLYGRNATGGAINIITAKPSNTLEGYGEITYGNYNTVIADGAISGPIVGDKVFARIAFKTEDHDGYGHNIVTGSEIDNAKRRSIRGSLEFRPSSAFSWNVTGDYHHEHDRNYSYHALGTAQQDAAGNPQPLLGIVLGGTVAANPRDISSERDPLNRRTTWGVTSEMKLELPFGTARSLTGYRYTNYLTLTDVDATNLRLVTVDQTEKARQFSQEFQLLGNGRNLQWLTGLYYFRERDQGLITAPFSSAIVGFPPPYVYLQGYAAGGRLGTDAYAAYGQLTYRALPKVGITLGGRYSIEKKGVDELLAFDLSRPFDPANVPLPLATQKDHKSFHAFTPRVSIDFKPNDETLIYASWSKGFKSGTYNLGGLQNVLKPEKVDAYEAGTKLTLFDRRLNFNVAGFYYNYSNLQVGKVINQSIALENAASATIYGLELEMRARPAARVEVNANAAWLHARFDSYISADPSRPGGDGVTLDQGRPAFNLRGNDLAQAPQFTASGGAQYSLPIGQGSLILRGELAWSDRQFFTPFNRPELSQGPATKANAFITYRSGTGWTVTGYVKDIGGHTTLQNAVVTVGLSGYVINGALSPPRTYGVTLGRSF